MSSTLFFLQAFSISSDPISSQSSNKNHNNINNNSSTKTIPTNPPWMRRQPPLHLQPHHQHPKPTSKNPSNIVKKSDKALTFKESGVRGKKAVKKIVKSIERLKKNGHSENTQMSSESFEVRETWEKLGDGGFVKKFPWEKEEKAVTLRVEKEKVVTKAEIYLDEELIGRLREMGGKMREWVKVKKAGVTQGVVDEIRFGWRRSELVMVKFDFPLCRNMDRAREILEMKTGGFVVWTKKDTHIIYRGHDSQLIKNADASNTDELFFRKDEEEESIPTGNMETNGTPIKGSLFERETDRLLEGLGPRFVDWWMRKPLPVDADLLPEVVSGFMPPSRLCPPRTRPKLNDDELTYLRKLAQSLPTHFVLGRNRRLQGLANAILKLWEKSHIAKIAVKWGVPNTNNEQMANELKYLTGGVLLLRNKFFIILYRGKDFLPPEVAKRIEDRESELKRCQLNEEGARLKAIDTFHMSYDPLTNTSKAGTLYEFRDIKMKYGEVAEWNMESELQLKAEKEKIQRELRNQEHKLFILKTKIEMGAAELSKLNSALTPAELDADREILTEEERQCFRKIGLKMHGGLVLGRRGVFDGVLEGLYQHWKHREVVKVITMQKKISQVFYTAKSLEAESGGILVSVDKLKEGHAIIIYRGKNYKRPLKLHTKNLLTKREALRRSLLMQKIGSLKFFAHQRQLAVLEMKSKLAELQESEKMV